MMSILACGTETTAPDDQKPLGWTAEITFVVKGIVPEVWRVDIAVNGHQIDPINGSFETALTDRITMRVPAGDSLNAFARGFEGMDTILYIGDTFFDVKDRTAQTVEIHLGYKGPHLPIP